MGVLLSRLSLLTDQPAGDSRCHVSAGKAKTAPSRSVSPVPSAVCTGGDGAQTKPETDLQTTGYKGSILEAQRVKVPNEQVTSYFLFWLFH